MEIGSKPPRANPYRFTYVYGLGLLIALVAFLGTPANPQQPASPCDSATVVPPGLVELKADCEALWDFYLGLQNQQYLNWGPDIPLLEWDGIERSYFETARVLVLSLPGLDLGGTLSSSLGDLTALETLNLSGNDLTGSIPDELGEIPRLFDLLLGDNRLTGHIPPALGQIHREGYGLRSGYLDSGPGLGVLDLSNNHLTGGIPTDLAALDVHTMDLSDNELTGPLPPALTEIPGLAKLHLGGNQLIGPIPDELGNAQDLLSLRLDNNQFDGPIPEALGNLVYLRVLDLSGNNLTGPIPPELGNIRYRNECLRSYEGVCVPPPGLSYLSLSHNELTGAIPDTLGATSLEHLDLSNNHLRGRIPDDLGLLVTLERIDLSRNELSGSIPAGLGQIREGQVCRPDPDGVRVRCRTVPGLLHVSLAYNDLSGSIPAELGALGTLESLSVRNNRLSGAIPPELAALVRLRQLDLSNNRLSGAIPDWLGTLPDLSSLDLGANLFTPPWPPNLTTPREGLVVNLPTPHVTADVSGPTYASTGLPVSLSLSVPPGGIVASVRKLTSTDTAEGTFTGDSVGVEFVSNHGGVFVFSAIVLHEDGRTFAGSSDLVVLDDIAESGFVEEILWLAEQGITRGCLRSSFCPDRPVTRGQMSAFLSRAFDLPAADDDYFDDDSGSIFEDDINRLGEAGLAHECAPRRFCNDQPLTRAQLAAFLSRAFGLPAALDDYFDDDSGSIFEEDINRLAETGILDGCGAHRFCPDGTIRRDEMAALFFSGRHLIVSPRA